MRSLPHRSAQGTGPRDAIVFIAALLATLVAVTGLLTVAARADGVGGRLQIFAGAADGVAGCCGEGHRRDAESEQDLLDHNIFLPKGPVTGVPENVT